MHKPYAIALALLVVFSGIPTGANAQEQSHNSIPTTQISLIADQSLVGITTTKLAVPNPVAPVVQTKVTRELVKQYAKEQFATTFAGQSFDQMNYIIENESKWDPTATNPYSGACGVAQMLPCIGKQGITAPGVAYSSLSYQDQVQLLYTYVSKRYGTVARAYAHKRLTGWY
jgi:hypothetical protein